MKENDVAYFLFPSFFLVVVVVVVVVKVEVALKLSYRLRFAFVLGRSQSLSSGCCAPSRTSDPLLVHAHIY